MLKASLLLFIGHVRPSIAICSALYLTGAMWLPRMDKAIPCHSLATSTPTGKFEYRMFLPFSHGCSLLGPLDTGCY